MTKFGHNGSSSGGIGGKSIGVGGIGIGVDVEIVGVIGGVGGMVLLLGFIIWAWMPLLLKGEKDPMRVLNRGVRIRGDGRVVEGLRVKGTDEDEAEGRG